MDLFKILGKIVVENSEANQALADTSSNARQAATDIGNSNSNIENSNKASGTSFSALKAKVAEYKEQGLTTSQAWKKASSEMKTDTDTSSNEMVGAFKKIGAAIGTYLAVDKVITFGKGCVEAAAQVKAQTAQFEAAFGDLGGEATQMFKGISKETGVLATRLQTVGTGAFSQFKGAGLEAGEALKKTSEYTNLAADAAAYYDMSLEEADSLMRSFIRGNTEAGDRLGLFTSETQRNEAALEKVGKKFIDCTEAEKQMIMLDIASSIYESSGAMGQAAREADGYENVVGNLKESWRQFMAVVGTPILSAVVPKLQALTEGISSLAEKTKSAIQWCKEHETIMTLIGIVVGTITTAIVAYNVAMNAAAIATAIVTTATTAFGAVMAFVTSPVTLVVAAIGALVAIGVALYKNWDTVSAKASKIWTKITEVVSVAWKSIKNAVTVGIMFVVELVKAAFTLITLPFRMIWENCKDVVLKVWNSIKSTVTNALNKVKSSVSSVLNSVKSAVSDKLGSVKSKFSSIFNSVKSTVSNAIGRVKSSISSGLNSAKSTVSSVLGGIKSKFTSIFNTVKTTVSNAINKIKGMFNFKWSLPKLKMPHFSLKGKFSLTPPSVPKLSVDWYQKAMKAPKILTKPTIFSYDAATGKAKGAGEAGSEIVGGTTTLMGMISSAVADRNEAVIYYLQKLADILSAFFPQIIDGMDQAVVLDDGTLVGKIAPKMDRELGRIKQRKDRGR